MTEFKIVDAKPYHVGRIVRRLRREHALSLSVVGFDKRRMHEELLAVYHDSAFRKAWLIDGELAALGGVAGPLAAPFGFVWLAFSQSAVNFPLAIVKEARRQLANIMETKTELATTILGNDEVALRFAAFLGFHTNHGVAKISRREQIEALKTDPGLRIPIGDGFAVAMGYHAEAR